MWWLRDVCLYFFLLLYLFDESCYVPATIQLKILGFGVQRVSIERLTWSRTVYPSGMSAPIIEKAGMTIDRIPEERAGSVEYMAGAILYLTSPAGGCCNGNVLVTDGGRLSLMPSAY